MIEVRRQAADAANYTPGRQGCKVEMIVLHLMDGHQDGTAAWFANPAASASAHYGVSQEGGIDQYVSESDTAWHAGKWSVNVCSIGIEHEGFASPANKRRWEPTNKQFLASVELAADICHGHNIDPTPETIRFHSEIFPAKPLCPGPGFPRDRYIGEILKRLEVKKLEAETNIPVRLFDPVTNKQIGAGTLVRGTDKIYVKSFEGKVLK